MQGGFQNPPVGNQGTLVRQWIQSLGFITGLTGWRISRSGSAEFNNVTIRNGQIISGTVLQYSGTPAAGNLIYSESAAGGTDQFGNVYLAGSVTYGQVAGTFFAVQQAGRGLTFLTATSEAGPWTNVASIVPLASGVLNVNAGNNLILNPNGGANTAVVGPGPATTTAVLEVQGDAQVGDGLSIGQGASVQTLVNNSTISTAGKTMQPVTAAASVTGIIVQAGTFDGQVIVIPSDAAGGNTITFAPTATSHVKAGVGAVIQPSDAMILVWVASTGFWYQVQ